MVQTLFLNIETLIKIQSLLLVNVIIFTSEQTNSFTEAKL